MLNSNITEELKIRKELRVEDFTEERVSSLKEMINGVYEEGVGISGKVLSQILFGYQQELKKYEGIAYHFFDLVATRDPNKKNGSLLLVRKSEIGSTLFPVAPSAYHTLDTVSSISSVKKAVDSVWADSSESSSSSISKSSSILSSLFTELSNTCSKIANYFTTI